MSFSLQTHHFEKVPNTAGYKIGAITPYCRISDGESCFYIQGGKIYTENGPEVKEVPSWVYAEAAKMTAKVKAEVGWEDPAPAVVAAAPQVPPATPAARPAGKK